MPFVRLTSTHLEVPILELSEGKINLPLVQVGDDAGGALVAAAAFSFLPRLIDYVKHLLRHPDHEYMQLSSDESRVELTSILAFADGRLLFCNGHSIIPLEPESLPLRISIVDDIPDLPVRRRELPPKVRLRLAGLDSLDGVVAS